MPLQIFGHILFQGDTSFDVLFVNRTEMYNRDSWSVHSFLLALNNSMWNKL